MQYPTVQTRFHSHLPPTPPPPPLSSQIYRWVIMINILNLQKDERSLQAVFFLQIKFSDSFYYYDKPWNVSINI